MAQGCGIVRWPAGSFMVGERALGFCGGILLADRRSCCYMVSRYVQATDADRRGSAADAAGGRDEEDRDPARRRFGAAGRRAQRAAGDPVETIIYETGPCFGTCPVYRVDRQQQTAPARSRAAASPR